MHIYILGKNVDILLECEPISNYATYSASPLIKLEGQNKNRNLLLTW